MTQIKSAIEGELPFLDHAAPIDVLRFAVLNELKYSRHENVALSNIVSEGAIIDENHARDLARALLGPWKQTQAIMLRRRIGGATVNDTLCDVLDGYHRVEGLRLVSPGEDPKIRAVVLYNCTDEEMYDQRILAANSVQSVKFARLGYWMKGTWNETPWKQKLTVAQAFGLAHNDGSGKIIGLTEDEATGIKAWVREKAKTWLMEVGTVYGNLRVIEASDPKLVMKVRTGSFSKGQIAITPAQLESVALAFPLEYPVQNIVADYASSHSLSSVQIDAIVTELAKVDIHDKEQIMTVLEGGNWKSGRMSLTSTNLYSTEQIHSAVKSLRKRVAFSGLSEDQKSSILFQVDRLGNHVNDVIGGSTRRSQELDDFAAKWINDRNAYANLTTHTNLRDELAKGLQSLDKDDLYLLGNMLIKRVFHKDTEIRDATSEIFKVFPLSSLNEDDTINFLANIRNEVVNLQLNAQSRDNVSDTVETLLETLSNIKYIQIRDPEGWQTLENSLEKLALKGDSYCRQAVTKWLKS